MTLAGFIDLPSDPWIYVILLGSVLILGGIFKISAKDVSFEAGKGASAIALFLKIVILGVGIAGAKGALGFRSPEPSDPHAQYKSGEALLQSGQDRKAIKEFQSAANTLGDDPCKAQAEWVPDLFADLGRAQLDVGNSEAAKQSFYTALCLNPDKQPVYDELARIAGDPNALAQDYLDIGYRLSNRAYAARIYTRYINLRPNDPVGYLKRGEAFNDVGQFADAAADFQRGDQLVPQQQNPDAYQSTQAYIDKDWGYTLLLETPKRCALAAQKFTKAKNLFDALHQTDSATQQGLTEVQHCKH
jgi:tetratricopeptide (TPR) repeat protein